MYAYIPPFPAIPAPKELILRPAVPLMLRLSPTPFTGTDSGGAPPAPQAVAAAAAAAAAPMVAEARRL